MWSKKYNPSGFVEVFHIFLKKSFFRVQPGGTTKCYQDSPTCHLGCMASNDNIWVDEISNHLQMPSTQIPPSEPWNFCLII